MVTCSLLSVAFAAAAGSLSTGAKWMLRTVSSRPVSSMALLEASSAMVPSLPEATPLTRYDPTSGYVMDVKNAKLKPNTSMATATSTHASRPTKRFAGLV